VRTNSRGETVVRIRGSEERQVQVFLDGAPLSVPWDGRADLGILPAGMIGSVSITPSAAPIEYGPNAVLGVVDLTSVTPERSGVRSAQVEGGAFAALAASAVGGVRTKDTMLVLAGSHMTRDGVAASDVSAIPYAPRNDDLRLNTDQRVTSFFGAAGRQWTSGLLRVSLLSANSKRGIAPEGHLDPALDRPRYWRYPEWKFNQLSVNARADLPSAISLRATAWLQRFEQTIDSFANATYSSLDAREQDEDETLGGRVSLNLISGRWGGRLVGNAQSSTHRQIDTSFPGPSAAPASEFRQDLQSLGAEADYSPIPQVALSIGASYDHVSSPKTGGRAAQPDLSDWAFSAAARWTPHEEWTLSSTLGRRTRFPTLRELYGEALGDFIINPNLTPETATLGDLTASWVPRRFALELEVTAWASRLEGTLARRSVVVGGTRFRQRYNQAGAEGYGLEALAVWRAATGLQLEWNGGFQSLRAERETSGARPTLYQRPDHQTSFSIDAQPSVRVDLRAELEHIGPAKDEGSSGEVVSLPSSSQVNLRLYYRINRLASEDKWLVYVSIENVSDALVLPQLGLPAPGRTYRVGLRLGR
jgi:iron complex outermembrane receptor protein